MTGIQDALATLRKEAGNVPAHRRAAFLDTCERVEDEIARLERRVEAEIDMRREASQAVLFAIERAEAAEAEVARLRDGLRALANITERICWEFEGGEVTDGSYALTVSEIETARALLAEDGAAQPVSYDELRGYVHRGAMRSKSPAPVVIEAIRYSEGSLVSGVARYRKKPVVIEAIRYTLENRDEVIAWCGATHTAIGEHGEEYELENLRIETLEGQMRADLGDWIIRGVQGEFYPCKPDIFDATYEAVA